MSVVFGSLWHFIWLALVLIDSISKCLPIYLSVTFSLSLSDSLWQPVSVAPPVCPTGSQSHAGICTMQLVSLSCCLSLSLSVCQDDRAYQGALVESHRDLLPAVSVSLSLLGGWWQEVKTLPLHSVTAELVKNTEIIPSPVGTTHTFTLFYSNNLFPKCVDFCHFRFSRFVEVMGVF